MKVENMTSRNGNKVPSQFIIYDDEGNRLFQSYSVIVAKIDKNGKIFIDSKYWNCSQTTSKYLNIFLGTQPGELKKAVKEGKLIPMNLNQEQKA